MRATKEIKINAKKITIQELTVAEIREALKLEDPESQVSAIDMLLLEEIGLPDLIRMTSLNKEEVEQMTPSELKIVAEACREVNADFFSLRRKILRYADLIEAGKSVSPG